jgi:hypothetical protein
VAGHVLFIVSSHLWFASLSVHLVCTLGVGNGDPTVSVELFFVCARCVTCVFFCTSMLSFLLGVGCNGFGMCLVYFVWYVGFGMCLVYFVWYVVAKLCVAGILVVRNLEVTCCVV